MPSSEVSPMTLEKIYFRTSFGGRLRDDFLIRLHCASSSDSGRDRRGGEVGSSLNSVDVPALLILQEIVEVVKLGPH